MNGIVRTRIPPKKSDRKRGVTIPETAISGALQVCLGSKTKAARMLNCTVNAVYKRIDKSPFLQQTVKDIYRNLVNSGEEVITETIVDGRNWRAAAWMLEKLDRVRYGKPSPEAEEARLGDLTINIVCLQEDGSVTKMTQVGGENKTVTLDPSEYEIQDGRVKLLEDKREGE